MLMVPRSLRRSRQCKRSQPACCIKHTLNIHGTSWADLLDLITYVEHISEICANGFDVHGDFSGPWCQLLQRDALCCQVVQRTLGLWPDLKPFLGSFWHAGSGNEARDHIGSGKVEGGRLPQSGDLSACKIVVGMTMRCS